EVPLQRVDIEGLELFGVVEVLLHRVGQVRMVMEHRKVELVRPPVLVRPRPAPLGSRRGDGRALAPRLFLVEHETAHLWLCPGLAASRHGLASLGHRTVWPKAHDRSNELYRLQ